MGDLTKNISRHEVRCKCGKCDFQTVDFETILVVQECCDHFAEKLGVEKVSVNINSGHRCFEYNRKPVSEGGPGSNDNSQHPRGNALDFKIKGVSAKQQYEYLDKKYPDKYGIGCYGTFTHMDSRRTKARWGY